MTDAAERALYQQVARDLRAQISSGDLGIGDAIPSTEKLKQQYGYSVTVVRRAVDILRTEGLLESQPGKGVFVKATPAQTENDKVTVEDLTQQVADLRAEVRDLTARVQEGQQVQDLASQLAELRSAVELLYSRLGHRYPTSDETSQQRSTRKTGT